jgi:hypothetical protein
MKESKHLRIAIVFKDFACWTGRSHVGLCVAALTNARVLAQHGYKTVVFPVRHNIDLVNEINQYNAEHEHPLTHVIISAPWLSRWDLVSLIEAYPEINFVVESHSNIGFLQADPWALHRFREIIELSEIYPNIRVAGNSHRLVDWMRLVYDRDVVLLPNLYPIHSYVKPKHRSPGVIKIGAFGAVRPQKNFLTAAAAAVAIQKILDIPVEFHMSTGGEGDGGSVSRAITEMTIGLPDFTLIRHDWQPWEQFIETISGMDLLLQPSYTESFNMITADGISVGVPSVTSSAITWAPENWKADSDDALDIACIGIGLLEDKDAIKDGLKAIRKQNENGIKDWTKYLTGGSIKRSLICRIFGIFK